MDWQAITGDGHSISNALHCIKTLLKESSMFQEHFYRLQAEECIAQILTETLANKSHCENFILMLVDIVQIVLERNLMNEGFLLSFLEDFQKLLSLEDTSISTSALISFTTILTRGHLTQEYLFNYISVEQLLSMVSGTSVALSKLSANILRLFSALKPCQKEIKTNRGIKILINVLESKSSLGLRWQIVWTLLQLCQDSELSTEITNKNGIEILTALILSLDGSYDENVSLYVQKNSLFSAVVSLLTLLCVDDFQSPNVIKSGCVAIIGKWFERFLLTNTVVEGTRLGSSVDDCALSCLRFLRILFSAPHNRCHFDGVFKDSVLDSFVAVGNYVHGIGYYQDFYRALQHLGHEEKKGIFSRLGMDAKSPLFQIDNMEVLRLLGSGAFGSVYKAKKPSGQIVALKEIAETEPKDRKNADVSKNIVNEVDIMKHMLNHRNVVRYYSAFILGNKTYICMEYIDGISLHQYLDGLRQKIMKMQERDIFRLLVQLLSGLNYLHNEKQIVHRDLTPRNIIISEGLKLTINRIFTEWCRRGLGLTGSFEWETRLPVDRMPVYRTMYPSYKLLLLHVVNQLSADFGLSHHYRNDLMSSVVGTILYACPEAVQNVPYSEKMDIWAIGCIVYEMCCLKSPFISNNILSIARKIAEGRFDLMPCFEYSTKLCAVINCCLIVDPNIRPNVQQVSQMISDEILKLM